MPYENDLVISVMTLTVFHLFVTKMIKIEAFWRSYATLMACSNFPIIRAYIAKKKFQGGI